MRLSDAMMLGSTTVQMVPGDIRSCALGAAGNAVGILRDEYRRLGRIQMEWPWLMNEIPKEVREAAPTPILALPGYGGFGRAITRTFNGPVCDGTITFEQLVDWVRSVEPDEPVEATETTETLMTETVTTEAEVACV
jgi:hypothetical protein